MAFARWSAMILALPTVTAFGVVSTGCVWSSSEIFKVLSPPEELVDVPPVILALPTLPTSARARAARLLLLWRTGAAFGTGRGAAGLSQRLNHNRQDIASGDIFQRTRDRFGKFDVGIKFRDQFANERHVDRPGHDMNAVRAHVGGEFDFAHHHRFLGQRGQRANFIFNRHRLRHGRSHATHPGWILGARFIAFLEDIF